VSALHVSEPVGRTSSVERVLTVAFIVACFVLYASWAWVIPFNAAPDESLRYVLVRYISEHGSIPVGTDPSIRDPIWGTSYAFEPILAPLVAAFLRSVAGLFTTDPGVLLLASRFASVIFGTGTVAMCILISRRLFGGVWRWFFVVFIALLPQFAFLSSYLNSDSLALFATALIIYAWLRGLRDGWGTANALLLGVGVSVCLLSYFTAYGFVLLSVVVYVSDRIHGWRHTPVDERRRYRRQTLVQVATIGAVVLVLAGWWFVRNAYLYDGDFLGLRTSAQQGALYAHDFAKPGASSAIGRGWTLWHMLTKGWILGTAISSIGVFGYMKVQMPTPIYAVYATITVVGMLLALVPAIASRLARHPTNPGDSDTSDRVDLGLTLPGLTRWGRRLFETVLLVAIPIPVALSMYHSYTQDYQPQGRYILPMLLPVAYFITKGFQRFLTRHVRSPKIRTSILIVFFAWNLFAIWLALVGVIIPHHWPHR
jgi:Dolichyl-phosphate-mannose-protein mannosyltransferase